jgi:hypothetical protein
MPRADITDLVIRYPGHPKYDPNKVVETDSIQFVIQKVEMCLFSNNGDVLGDENFGANTEFYLWSTQVPSENIQQNVKNQIDTYVPELNTMGYTLNVNLYQGTVRDILYINIAVKGVKINFVVS